MAAASQSSSRPTCRGLGEFLRRRQHGGIEPGDFGTVLRIAHRFMADA
jgi:hypothetical protein